MGLFLSFFIVGSSRIFHYFLKNIRKIGGIIAIVVDREGRIEAAFLSAKSFYGKIYYNVKNVNVDSVFKFRMVFACIFFSFLKFFFSANNSKVDTLTKN